MAIDSIGSSIYSQDLLSTSGVTNQQRDPDGDSDGPRVQQHGGGGGRFAAAISQALTQIGVTPPDGASATAGATASTDSSTSATDASQAVQAFAHALFSALQGQSGAPSDAGSGAPKGEGGGHHHHGGGGKIESGLQNLIQQLGASGSTDSTGSDALSNLQTSFDQLVKASGGDSSSDSLSGFLQHLAQDLHGAPSSGNVVSTKA